MEEIENESQQRQAVLNPGSTAQENQTGLKFFWASIIKQTRPKTSRLYTNNKYQVTHSVCGIKKYFVSYL